MRNAVTILVLIITLVAGCLLSLGVCESNQWVEAALIGQLMTNYTRESRPVVVPEQPVAINMSMTLAQLIHLDDKTEVLTAVVWFTQIWVDERLVWDPQQYGGKSALTFPSDRIWGSDLYVYNVVGNTENIVSMFLGSTRENAIISSGGKVTSYMPIRLDTSCHVDLHWFPFDTQVCTIVVGSWAYSTKEVIYKVETAPRLTPDFYQGAWWVSDPEAHEQLYHEEAMELNYSLVSFSFHMQRNPTSYVLNLIVPSLLVNMIMLVSLCLPVECGERVSVGLTVFMAYSVFTLIITEIVPESARLPPLICVSFLVNMALALTTIGWTAFVIRAHHRASSWAPLSRATVNFVLAFSARENKHTIKTHGKNGIQEEERVLSVEGREVPARNFETKDVIFQTPSCGGQRSPPADQREDSNQAEWMLVLDFGDKLAALVYLLVSFANVIALFITYCRQGVGHE